MNLKSVITYATGAAAVVLLLSNLGFDTKEFAESIFGLKAFANNAVLKLKRVYSLALSADYQTIVFKLDLDVENNSTTSVTASNLIINAYNANKQLIGNSKPYPGPVNLPASSITTINGIEIAVNVSKLIESYGSQAWELIKQMFATMSANNIKLNETITLDVFIQLNGLSVNEQINYTI